MLSQHKSRNRRNEVHPDHGHGGTRKVENGGLQHNRTVEQTTRAQRVGEMVVGAEVKAEMEEAKVGVVADVRDNHRHAPHREERTRYHHLLLLLRMIHHHHLLRQNSLILFTSPHPATSACHPHRLPTSSLLQTVPAKERVWTSKSASTHRQPQRQRRLQSREDFIGDISLRCIFGSRTRLLIDTGFSMSVAFSVNGIYHPH